MSPTDGGGKSPMDGGVMSPMDGGVMSPMDGGAYNYRNGRGMSPTDSRYMPTMDGGGGGHHLRVAGRITRGMVWEIRYPQRRRQGLPSTKMMGAGGGGYVAHRDHRDVPTTDAGRT